MNILQPFEGELHINAPFGQNRTDPNIWGEKLSNFYKNLGTCCHMGVDLRARFVPLRAGVTGTVIGTAEATTAGQFDKSLWVRIQADEPHEGGYIVIGFFHMRDRTVNVGDRVTPTTVIGTSGNSGKVGAHLHLGVRHINIKLSPETYHRLASPRIWMNQEHRGHIDPMPLLVNSLETQTDMRHVILPTLHQYLVYDSLKIAFNIADEDELELLKDRGLGNSPEIADNLDGYLIFHGASTDGINNFFNL